MGNNTEIKNYILNQIFEFYVNSSDHNGIGISALGNKKHAWTDITASLIQLIEEGNINTVSSADSGNIHIIRFGFMPIEHQINDIINLSGDKDFACYPSSDYLKKHRDISAYQMRPFDAMLALGTPQLELQYFEWDVLDKYSEDPRFEFEFRDYEGEIYATESLPESEYINLRTFGTGRDSENRRVVAAYPRYLRNMSPTNQIHWHSKMLDRTMCKHLKAYHDNKILCSWHFPDSVYSAILKEMFNIDQIAEHIWDRKFFKKDYLTERPADFGTIFKPTLARYNAFLLVFEKIIPNNLNPDFFDKVHNDGTSRDGKKKGTIHRFREWLEVVNRDIADEIIKPIKTVRDLRQAPAHKIESNKYDYCFFEEQQEITQELLESLILYRRLLLTHSKAENFAIQHKNETIVIP